MGEKPNRALVILSGGQDSTTCLFAAVERFKAENVSTVTFDYGQLHKIELEAAKKVATMAGIAPENQELIKMEGILKSTSPLVDHKADLEQYKNAEEMAEQVGDRIENTFVPMRNALFLVVAVNCAVSIGADWLYTGVCQEDNGNYPDCRKPFIRAIEHASRLALDDESIMIKTPLMHMTKAESVLFAMDLPGCMEALAYSHTAYDGQYPPVGNDHATILRAKGFEEAGVADPLVVRANKEGKMELPATSNYDVHRKK